VIYDKVRPNPTYEICEEVASLAKEKEAKAFMGIGGGSPQDTAKTAAALLRYPDKKAKDLYEEIITMEDAAPIICINTTHGTGTEVDHWAVAQCDGGFKPFMGGLPLYPIFSIDDPALTKTLPLDQTISTSLDALSHAFESATTTIRNPYCTVLSIEAARLTYRWLPIACVEPENIRARYWLLYAAAIAGIAMDIALTHLGHASEHSLSALNPKIAHGTGLAAILPSVVKLTYRVLPEVCAEFFRPIIPDLEGKPREAEYAAREVEGWSASIGRPEKLENLGFSKDDIPRLTENAWAWPTGKFVFRISPVKVTKELIKSIFEESLEPLAKK